MKEPNLTKLVQQVEDPEVLDDLVEGEQCRSTRTGARRDTSGMSTERSRRARKRQKTAVRNARRAKAREREESRFPRG